MLKRFMCLFCLVFTASSVHAEDLLGLYKASLEADPALRSMQLWVVLAWSIYFPVAEYFYGRTFGMKFVKTRIFGVDGGKVPWSAVSRRHVARISMFWGILG